MLHHDVQSNSRTPSAPRIADYTDYGAFEPSPPGAPDDATDLSPVAVEGASVPESAPAMFHNAIVSPASYDPFADARLDLLMKSTKCPKGKEKRLPFKPQETPVRNVLESMCTPQVGPEEGWSVLPGEVLGARREAKMVKSLYGVGLEINSGVPADVIDKAIVKSGILMVRYTAHGHMRTTSEFLADRVAKSEGLVGSDLKDEGFSVRILKSFMTKEKFEQSVVASVSRVERVHTEDGFMLRVTHAPLPMHRLFAPFLNPFVFKEQASEHAGAIALWKKIPQALARALSVPVDAAGADPSRSLNRPRHEVDAPFECKLFGGDFLDFPELLRVDLLAPAVAVAPKPEKITACTRIPQLEEMSFDARHRWQEDADDAVEWFAARAVQVNMGGKTLFVTLENGCLQFRSANEALTFYRSFLTQVNQEKDPQKPPKFKTVEAFRLYTRSSACRLYSRVDCDPSYSLPSTVFNVWEGIDTAPSPGEWPLLQEHILNCICAGNQAHYQVYMDWHAHMFQKPWEKPGFAPGIVGPKGSGKSTVAVFVCEIIGDTHSIKVSQARHMLGNFNAHHASMLFVVSEESTWAGNKQEEGPLKDMITSETMMLERKGVDATKMRSFARYIFISNGGHVVPATGDERRFAYFQVNDLNAGKSAAEKKAYFDALHYEFNHGGKEAFLAHLLERDISAFDRFSPPRTAGLVDQIKKGLPPAMLWWWGVLERGSLTDREGGEIGDQWPLYRSSRDQEEPAERDGAGAFSFTTADLTASFGAHVKSHNGSTIDGGLGFLSVFGEFVDDPKALKKRLTLGKHDRPWGYTVGDRQWWRDRFTAKMGVTFSEEKDEEGEEVLDASAGAFSARGSGSVH